VTPKERVFPPQLRCSMNNIPLVKASSTWGRVFVANEVHSNWYRLWKGFPT
jgi:hypothetical protein